MISRVHWRRPRTTNSLYSCNFRCDVDLDCVFNFLRGTDFPGDRRAWTWSEFWICPMLMCLRQVIRITLVTFRWRQCKYSVLMGDVAPHLKRNQRFAFYLVGLLQVSLCVIPSLIDCTWSVNILYFFLYFFILPELSSSFIIRVRDHFWSQGFDVVLCNSYLF